jgi:hypothetical protein
MEVSVQARFGEVRTGAQCVGTRIEHGGVELDQRPLRHHAMFLRRHDDPAKDRDPAPVLTEASPAADPSARRVAFPSLPSGTVVSADDH